MSNHLGTKETVALLRRLEEAIGEFAAREEKLNAEFRSRSSAENRRFDSEATAQAAQASQAVANAAAAFKAEKERTDARFEQRKRRISQGHMASRKRAMEKIHEREGRQKYKTQEGTINAERRREKDLAEAAANLQQFNQNLEQMRQGIAALESRTQNAFRGYGRLRRMFAIEKQPANLDLSGDENQLLEQLQGLEASLGERLDRFRRMLLPMALRHFPFWLLIAVLLIGCAFLLPFVQRFGDDTMWQRVGFGLIGVSILLMAARTAAKGQAKPLAAALADDLARARRLGDACFEKAQSRHHQERERIKNEYDETIQHFDQDWKRVVKESINLLDVRPKKIDEQAQRVTQKNEQFHATKLKRLEHEQPDALARLQTEGDVKSKQLADEHAAKVARLEAEIAEKWQELEADWKSRIQPIHEAIQTANAESQALFPDWRDPSWEKWTPPEEFENAAKFGRLEVNINQLAETAPKDKRLAFPGPENFAVPLVLTYPAEGSILVETKNTGAEEVMAAINNIIFRLLATTPPGKLSFTIFDPVGLGQNFAGLMHLADYEESHINSRIWTQTDQIEEKLAELNEHMEKVIQMYLRNEYATIAEYNAQAGTIAEKYHFLVIADFPVNFSDSRGATAASTSPRAARVAAFTRSSIGTSAMPLPPGFCCRRTAEEQHCVWPRDERGFKLAAGSIPGTRLVLDAPPAPEFATEFLHQGRRDAAKDSNRVEVPFAQIAPPDARSLDGRHRQKNCACPSAAPARRSCNISPSAKARASTRLIAGKTGSGKSTLFHVMITNLALWCSPEQVEFYLVDFKKGVEFKCYATRDLPHARVVAIESDREFGLSVLQRVDDELRRRGDLFRQLGVQDVAGYKRAGGNEPMPRSLLIIDEFQEFFTEEDRVSQGAAVLLDRIVRQGRAFGIHVLLGSQTLGGAYTLARATIGQMVIRIALQCNEADAYLIMDQDNPAPRLLSRPGEGIYNDAAGSIEGNSPFQAVWLPEEVRDDYLAKIRERADQDGARFPGTICV